MKTLTTYIAEGNKKDDAKVKERAGIKFTIWERPDKQVAWLEDNEKYQKIEYKYEDKKAGVQIDFLLGFDKGSWKMWTGKFGVVSYEDDPYKDFKTDDFAVCINSALDEVQDFIEEVKNNKDNWIQFYIRL